MKKRFKTFITSDAEILDREIPSLLFSEILHVSLEPVGWTLDARKGTEQIWKKFHESAELASP
ncbi:MAG TPA: hypothetical protein VJQ82_27070 [Terriglobales bacterium]|nr:hypothetical protein [Terriglobales bacterium]